MVLVTGATDFRSPSLSLPFLSQIECVSRGECSDDQWRMCANVYYIVNSEFVGAKIDKKRHKHFRRIWVCQFAKTIMADKLMENEIFAHKTKTPKNRERERKKSGSATSNRLGVSNRMGGKT